MKHRFWIALALALALTLTAFAEEMIPADGAEDALVVEDLPTEGEAEPTVEEADELLPGDIAPEEADGLLPGDTAPEEEIADMPPATDAEAAANGAVANKITSVFNWDELESALLSAQNGDTIDVLSEIHSPAGHSPAKAHTLTIERKAVTVNLKAFRIVGDIENPSLFIISNGGELVLKGGEILNAHRAVDVDVGDCRFTMKNVTIRESDGGVYNDGVFIMEGGTITQNHTGVENCGTFIAGGKSGKCEISGNNWGVVTYSSDTAVTVSGFVVIKGNTEYDVLLQKGQVVAVGGPLDQQSRIGITLSSGNLPGPGAPVVVTRGLKGNGTAENFFVWGDYETEINADGELEVRQKGPSIVAPDATLLAKLTASGKRALKLSWTKVEGAQGYDVFLGLCKEGSFKKAATVTDARNCKLKGLKRGRTYQAYVKAWEKSGGKKTYIGKSPTVYAITGGYNGTRCNPKSVKVSKSSLKLKTGKSAKVRARVKGVKPGRKGLHQCKLVRWYSSDRSVAKVNGDGKVTAVAKGKCTIYAVANNGVRASVKVTVK